MMPITIVMIIHLFICRFSAERFGSGDGERQASVTRQMPYEPSPLRITNAGLAMCFVCCLFASAVFQPVIERKVESGKCRTFDVMSPRHCDENEKEIEMIMGG
ncbi:MAG: hypothetical protein ORN51_01625 [Akkermansiaceae bacterium]|nr:hypothetical protein [Akkermansiaceae bacterium]